MGHEASICELFSNTSEIGTYGSIKLRSLISELNTPLAPKPTRKIKAIATFLGHPKDLKMLTKLRFRVAN